MATISLSVLCPTGHTVTVKVSPNDPVLKIVEATCQKRKLDPDRHVIRHNRTRLDSSALVRFANLTNHAKLELVELSPDEIAAAGSATSTIALQLEDGSRIQDQFPVSCLLSDMLQQLVSDGKISNLSSDDGKEPVIVYMTKEVVGLDEIGKTTLRSLGIVAGGRVLLRLLFRDPKAEKSLTTTFKPNASVTTAAASSAASAKRPESPPRRAMRVDDGQSFLSKLKDQVKPQVPDSSADASEVMPEPDPTEPAQVEEQSPTETRPKPEPEREKVKEVLKRDPEPLEPPVINYLDEEKRVLAFELNGAKSGLKVDTHAMDEIEDDFFELSVAEVKKLYADRVREVVALSQDLLTSASREARKEAARLNILNRYRHAVIRIQFPGNHVLQLLMSSHHSVEDVMKLVKPYLLDQDSVFELFTSPPKTVLDPKASLLEVDCIPSAIVYFSQTSPKKHPELLKPEVLANLSNLAGAVKAAEEAGLMRKKRNAPDTLSDEALDDDSERKGEKSAKTLPTSSQSGAKIPAWLAKGKQ